MQALTRSLRWLNAAAASVSYFCFILAIFMNQPFWAGFNAAMCLVNLLAAVWEPAA